MLSNKFFYWILILLLFAFGCSKEEDGGTPSGSDPEFMVPTIVPSGNEKYLSLDSDYLFDQNALRTYELKLPIDALASIDADPAAEKYVEGMLIFEGDTVSPVGIRYKGSVGGFVGCVSRSD